MSHWASIAPLPTKCKNRGITQQPGRGHRTHCLRPGLALLAPLSGSAAADAPKHPCQSPHWELYPDPSLLTLHPNPRSELFSWSSVLAWLLGLLISLPDLPACSLRGSGASPSHQACPWDSEASPFLSTARPFSPVCLPSGPACSLSHKRAHMHVHAHTQCKSRSALGSGREGLGCHQDGPSLPRDRLCPKPTICSPEPGQQDPFPPSSFPLGTVVGSGELAEKGQLHVHFAQGRPHQ